VRSWLPAGCIVQLTASTSLLMWAALTHGAVPRWAGVVDVALAFALVCAALTLRIRTEQARARTMLRSYGAAATLPSALIIVVWWFRDRLDLNILLPGLAWRLFVLFDLMPALLASLNRCGDRAAVERS
jgi:hypothetical protein